MPIPIRENYCSQLGGLSCGYNGEGRPFCSSSAEMFCCEKVLRCLKAENDPDTIQKGALFTPTQWIEQYASVEVFLLASV